MKEVNEMEIIEKVATEVCMANAMWIAFINSCDALK